MLDLDLAFVRAQFPAFAETSLQGQAFFENAGGSYSCRQVTDRLAEYYRRLKVQPYYPYPASTEAGAWMDASHTRLAEYLNVATDELHFGPSSSQNTYVLAQAFGKLLVAGDEIIVTNQDHEANSGVWRRMAEGLGVGVREWSVDPASGSLSLAALQALISHRTRLICLPHCSNVLAEINPVAEVCALARSLGIVTVVDGVAWAPHGMPDVAALGADVYFFSLYKTFGPHQGLMVVRRSVFDQLGNEGHYFNAGSPRKRLLPAGPDHAQVAAARGIAEYFDALDAHHGGGTLHDRPLRVRELIRSAEVARCQQLIDGLAHHRDLRLLGPADASARAPTLAYACKGLPAQAIATALAGHGILCAAGHFYAVRLLEALGIDPGNGVLRLSMAHYTTAAEVDALLAALATLL